MLNHQTYEIAILILYYSYLVLHYILCPISKYYKLNYGEHYRAYVTTRNLDVLRGMASSLGSH